MEHPRGNKEDRRRATDVSGRTAVKWRPYAKFGAMLFASLASMYVLAFSQIEQLAHLRFSLSVLWISISMVSAMAIIMLASMQKMLPHRNANVGLGIVFCLALVGAFSAGRSEAGVEDDAFLDSMIPHHSRAIHMCREAALADPEIIALCGQIIDAQRREIEQMERIAERRS